jgi:pimeloyl-ACP methyl ester carboxylesterase
MTEAGDPDPARRYPRGDRARPQRTKFYTRLGLLYQSTTSPASELTRCPTKTQVPGYPTVARAVYQNLPSLIAARSRYPEVKAPIHLVYGEKDWSRPSDRETNKELLPAATFIQVPGAGHFIALERPDVLANLLNSVGAR